MQSVHKDVRWECVARYVYVHLWLNGNVITADAASCPAKIWHLHALVHCTPSHHGIKEAILKYSSDRHHWIADKGYPFEPTLLRFWAHLKSISASARFFCQIPSGVTAVLAFKRIEWGMRSWEADMPLLWLLKAPGPVCYIQRTKNSSGSSQRSASGSSCGFRHWAATTKRF